MIDVNDIWYKKSVKSTIISFLLLPFSFLFFLISKIRFFLYKKDIFKSYLSSKFVIVVGNITVGGSGKTPLAIAILKRLRQEGFNPCLLSRGYKAKPPFYPYEVQETDSYEIAGDEPLLIKKESKERVFIAKKRVDGAFLIDSIDDIDVIVMDDGLQHYALNRDFEIVVLDKNRMLGNKLLLPAGPLRESEKRLKSVDAIVVNGNTSTQMDDNYYNMTLEVTSLKTLDGSVAKLDKGTEVCALSGIGNPKRFYKTLETMGFIVKDTIDVGDHLVVSKDVLKEKSKDYPLIMTAKDAVKYTGLNLNNIYILNVESHVDEEFYVSLLKILGNKT